MMKIELNDIIDTLAQMYDDVIELYDGDTIYSFLLDVAINTLRGRPIRQHYYGNIL